MTIPRTSLRGFLSQAKSTLASAIRKREAITLVIGNESADLDSITSSILYAYIRSQTPRSTPPGSLYIPVVNMPKADIALRPELAPVCRAANISTEHIIALDDLPPASDLANDLPPSLTKWVLVDHNALQGTLSRIYASRVAGCIDHHDDEHAVPTDTGDEPRIITRAGSCTSLVTNYIRPTWDGISSAASNSGSTQSQGDGLADDVEVAELWDAQVAMLALGSVLIDTVEMKDGGKVTEHDERAVEYLEARVNACPRVGKGYERGTYFEAVQAAKGDLDGLRVEDVLRKDYKMWVEDGLKLGVSSVVKPLRWLYEKAEQECPQVKDLSAFVMAAEEFARSRELDVFTCMTAFTGESGGFARELLMVTTSEEARKAVHRFREASGGELQLEDVDERPNLRVWKQRNASASRKQVGPLLRKATNDR